MSGACHSRRPGGERSDDNDADADDLMSREDSPEAGEEENDNQEENINWHASSFLNIEEKIEPFHDDIELMVENFTHISMMLF